MKDPAPIDNGPHGRPSAAELVAAVREFLDAEVRPATTGAVSFRTRIASNVLAMVERELTEPDSPDAGGADLLGAHGEYELATLIRDGRLDDRFDDVVDVLDHAIRRRLAVAHPGYEENL